MPSRPATDTGPADRGTAHGALTRRYAMSRRGQRRIESRPLSLSRRESPPTLSCLLCLSPGGQCAFFPGQEGYGRLPTFLSLELRLREQPPEF